MMIRLLILMGIALLLFVIGCWAEFRQEQAKVTYFNPKYMADIKVITRRASRHAPYLTNLTFSILKPFGNNVTYSTILQLKNGGDFKISNKICDTLKYKWMKKFMSKFTNLTLDKCPFPPGRYAYMNMELPPQGMPIPVLDGDYFCIMEMSLTASKEVIFSAKALLHFDNRASNNEPSKSDRSKKDKKG